MRRGIGAGAVAALVASVLAACSTADYVEAFWADYELADIRPEGTCADGMTVELSRTPNELLDEVIASAELDPSEIAEVDQFPFIGYGHPDVVGHVLALRAVDGTGTELARRVLGTQPFGLDVFDDPLSLDFTTAPTRGPITMEVVDQTAGDAGVPWVRLAEFPRMKYVLYCSSLPLDVEVARSEPAAANGPELPTFRITTSMPGAAVPESAITITGTAGVTSADWSAAYDAGSESTVVTFSRIPHHGTVVVSVAAGAFSIPVTDGIGFDPAHPRGVARAISGGGSVTVAASNAVAYAYETDIPPGPPIRSTTGAVTLPAAAVGVPVERSLGAAADVIDNPTGTWELIEGSLPDGLSLGADGVLAGTPTTAEERSFTVRVTNVHGSLEIPFVLPIPPYLEAVAAPTLCRLDASTVYARPATWSQHPSSATTSITLRQELYIGYTEDTEWVDSVAGQTAAFSLLGVQSSRQARGTTTASAPGYTTTTSTGAFVPFSSLTDCVFSLDYDLDGGEPGDPANPPAYGYATPDFGLAPPTRDHHAFSGWSGTGIGDGVNDTVMAVTIPAGSTGDREYRAHWTIDSYAVSFEPDGGSTVPGATVGHGSLLPRPDDPFRAGWTFAGWLLDGLPYDFSEPVTGPLDLVAAWQLPAAAVAPSGSGPWVVEVDGDGGFQPGETVDVEIHSTPVHLGTATADADGRVSGSFSVPASVGSGAHTLVLKGRMSLVTVNAAVALAAPPPAPPAPPGSDPVQPAASAPPIARATRATAGGSPDAAGATEVRTSAGSPSTPPSPVPDAPAAPAPPAPAPEEATPAPPAADSVSPLWLVWVLLAAVAAGAVVVAGVRIARRGR